MSTYYMQDRLTQLCPQPVLLPINYGEARYSHVYMEVDRFQKDSRVSLK